MLRPKLSSFVSSRWMVYLAFIVVLGIFFTLTLRLSLTASLMEGSDQPAHYLFSRFIAQHRRLPVNEIERQEAGYKSDSPPLFHLVVGIISSSINLDLPPFIKLTRDNPRLQLVFGTEDILTIRVLTPSDPYQGEVLVWYLGRWVTILCSLVALVATFWLLRVFFPPYPWLAVSLTALFAFTPVYVITSGIISYEALLGGLLVLYFLILFYTLKYPQQNWFYLALGLLLGAAALTKFTALPVVPFLFVFVFWLAHREKWGRQETLSRLLLVSLGLFVTLGSWLLYMIVYFNRVAELGWMAGLIATFLGDSGDETTLRILESITGVKKVVQTQYHDNFFEWIWNFISGIWRSMWLIVFFIGLWSVVLAGLVRQWRHSDEKRLWITLLAIHLILLMVASVIRFAMTGFAKTAEGHHIFFPMVAPLSLLLAWGILAWFSPSRSTWLFTVAAGLSLVQSIFMVNRMYYPSWPIQTVPFTPNEQALAYLSGMSLIDYEYVTDDQSLQVTLYWRADQLLKDDYQVELALLDAQKQLQARWIGQPLNGRYPTRAWDIGDRVSDAISVPIAGLPTGTYQVQLRVRGEDGVLDARITDQPSMPVIAEDYGLTLDKVVLTPSSVKSVDTVKLNDQEIGYTLWPYAHGASAVYGERSTIVFWVRETRGEEIHTSLVGPDERLHKPAIDGGHVVNFIVEPHFANGEYRLRFEKGNEWVETTPLLHIKTEMRQFEIGPISHPLAANFANQLMLLGYDLPQRKVLPGEALPVTLHWQTLEKMNVEYILFSNLVNESRERWGGNERMAREIYSTVFWVPGEIVTDPYNIQVDANASDGIYHLLVGVYLPVNQEAVSLPLVQEDQLTDITSVNLGLIKVGQTLPEFIVEQANPQNPVNQPFGLTPNLTLLGYDLVNNAGQPIMDGRNARLKLSPNMVVQSSNLILTLYWRSESPLPIDYTTFVHLRNADGEIVAQKDQPPLKGDYPTGLWNPGEVVADEIIVPLPENLPAGKYQLMLGLYDFYTSQRLTVPGHPANEVKLFDVELF